MTVAIICGIIGGIVLFFVIQLAKNEIKTDKISAQLSSPDPNILAAKDAEINHLESEVKVLLQRNEELANELKRKVAK